MPEDNFDKYLSVDKQATKEIMEEFEGEQIEHDCPSCKGVVGDVCLDCGGLGVVIYEY